MFIEFTRILSIDFDFIGFSPYLQRFEVFDQGYYKPQMPSRSDFNSDQNHGEVAYYTCPIVPVC